jgi:hypothetical protein
MGNILGASKGVSIYKWWTTVIIVDKKKKKHNIQYFPIIPCNVQNFNGKNHQRTNRVNPSCAYKTQLGSASTSLVHISTGIMLTLKTYAFYIFLLAGDSKTKWRNGRLLGPYPNDRVTCSSSLSNCTLSSLFWTECNPVQILWVTHTTS